MLFEQVEQDPQLGPVVEVVADQAQRVGVEDLQQLVVGEAEPLLEVAGAQNRSRSSSTTLAERPVPATPASFSNGMLRRAPASSSRNA